jgi:hypothetical protein
MRRPSRSLASVSALALALALALLAVAVPAGAAEPPECSPSSSTM